MERKDLRNFLDCLIREYENLLLSSKVMSYLSCFWTRNITAILCAV